jgi:hypothetical protein
MHPVALIPALMAAGIPAALGLMSLLRIPFYYDPAILAEIKKGRLPTFAGMVLGGGLSGFLYGLLVSWLRESEDVEPYLQLGGILGFAAILGAFFGAWGVQLKTIRCRKGGIPHLITTMTKFQIFRRIFWATFIAAGPHVLLCLLFRERSKKNSAAIEK